MKKVKLQLNQLMHNRNLSNAQLYIKAGFWRAALSNLANNRVQQIQFDHLNKTVNALDITDMNEALRIVESEKVR